MLAGARPWWALLGVFLLAGCLLGAYYNTWHVPFLLDDDDAIGKNATLRSWATALIPPTNSGSTVSGRPLLNFSFAINHRIGGTNVVGYHVGNLLIHFAAALCLFGVVRRTLRRPVLAERFGAHATLLAWFVSAWWALHPLQTESVTYIVQRAESLVGLFYLLTLYAFVRGIEKPSRGWRIVAVVACFLGMAAKEVMASAPLVLLLYDRTFISGTFRESWRCHGKLHVAFASSWVLLLGLVIASGGRGSTVGFAAISWLDYALTQGPGIAGYLSRALVPVNLVFDYGAIVEKRAGVIAVGILLVAALLSVTIGGLKKRPAAGFLGAWFFLILAPTSSVIPVASQTLAEHRMYLPLAAVVLAATLTVYRLAPRAAWWVLSGLTLATALTTRDRNHDYRSGLALWEDTARKVPDNVRALNNLGICYRDAERLDDAIRCFNDAIDLAPRYANAYSNLGTTLMRKALGPSDEATLTPASSRVEGAAPISGRIDAAAIERALSLLHRAVELEPANALFHSACGSALLEAGQGERSLASLQRAVSLAPENSAHYFNYANALLKLDRLEEAAVEFETALRHEPAGVDLLVNYGILLRRMGRREESIEQLRAASKLASDSARVRSNLGVSLLARGDKDEGIRELSEALRLRPGLPQAHYHLGNALAETGRIPEAIAHLEALLKTAAPSAELLSNLGVLYARAGRIEAAIEQMRRALELDPKHAAARENLDKLTAYLRSQSPK